MRRGLVTALAAIVAVSLVRVPYREAVQTNAEANLGELLGNFEVGQGFSATRDRLSGFGYRFATYSDRENTRDIIFELRAKPSDLTPLRTARVNARALQDHGLFTFRFPAIRDSRGKSFYAAVRSPSSEPGNAVTVEYGRGDPYRADESSVLYLLRAGRSDPDASARALKPDLDLFFTTSYDVSIPTLMVQQTIQLASFLRRHPGEVTEVSLLTLLAGIVATILVSGERLVLRRCATRGRYAIVLAALVLALLLRHFYLGNLPWTNDEGTVLYDAWSVREGRLPGGDGVIKTPVAIAAYAAWLAAVGPALGSTRYAASLLSLLTVLPLLYLARRLGLTALARVSLATLALLTAAPAVYGLYGHAQPVQLLLGVTGLAFLAAALGLGGAAAPRYAILSALLAGALFGLAFGARKSSLALALPVLGLLAMPEKNLPWTWRMALGGVTLASAVAVVGVTSLAEYVLYGAGGFSYFLGLAVAAIQPETTGSIAERRAALLRALLPVLRVAPPLLFLAFFSVASFLRDFLRSRGRPLLAFAAFPLLAVSTAGLLRFLSENERGEFLAFGLVPLYGVFTFALFGTTLLPPPRSVERTPAGRVLAFSLAWFAGLVAVYGNWVKFSAHYFTEFLPPLLLLAASGASALATIAERRRVLRVAAAALLGWATLTSALSAARFPFTGTFDLRAVREMAALLREHVPAKERIFTGAVGIPVLSGHRVLLDVAHPTHYGYGFIEPEVRDVYLPPAETMVTAVRRDARWALVERLTAFSYFREYPTLTELIEKEFVLVAEVENRNNPLRLLRRRE